MEKLVVPRVIHILLPFLLAVSIFSFIVTARAAGVTQATIKLNEAEDTLAEAYIATLEAENARAGVSDLLVQLNEAGESLARAYMAYRADNFDQTILSAKVAIDIGEKVKSEADELKAVASAENLQRLWLTVVGSFIGAVLIAIGVLLSWRIFKHHYYERILKMKPEAVSSES